MNIIEALALIKRRQRMTNLEIAKAIDRSPQFLSAFFHRDETQVSTACNIADALGYELILRKVDGDITEEIKITSNKVISKRKDPDAM